MAVSLVSTGVTFPDNSTQTTAATDFGFKNRIINGAMVIDQRNAGASVTPATTATYATDRWRCGLFVASKFSFQQSSTAPTGFINSLLLTSTSAYTVGSTEQFSIAQYIEGYNVADLAFGTASAATVTLSFWVRSSLTGLFGATIKNSANDRSYPFSYTISSANTWEQKTVTITGDTTGTWLTTNGIGIHVAFSLGAGSTLLNTGGSWYAGNYVGVTGQTNLVSTNGATLYITGVQLEKGSTATSFDYRPIGTELQLCQRYAYVWTTTSTQVAIASGFQYNASSAYYTVNFPVQMRSAPTLNAVTASNWNNIYQGAQGTTTGVAINASSVNSAALLVTQTSSTGYSNILWSGTTSANMQFVAEL